MLVKDLYITYIIKYFFYVVIRWIYIKKNVLYYSKVNKKKSIFIGCLSHKIFIIDIHYLLHITPKMLKTF